MYFRKKVIIMRKTTVFAVMVMSLALVSCSKSNDSGVCTPTPTPIITVAPTSTPVVTVKPTTEPAVTVKPTATPIDRSSKDYNLTEYDKTHIRFYLQELDNKNITEKDLSEVYETYGTEKVNQVREEMDKEYEADRKRQEQKAQKARKEAKKKAKKQALAQKESFISKSCNKSLNKSLLSYADKVPDNILKAVKNMGYHLELVQEPGAEVGLRGICGLTLPEQKRILIQAREYKFRRAVVHEIGHAYDDYLNWISCSDEFIRIYNAEKNDFVVHDYRSTHYLDNEMEYFAEAFQEYIYYPNKLKANTPKTYKFIKNLMK